MKYSFQDLMKIVSIAMNIAIPWLLMCYGLLLFFVEDDFSSGALCFVLMYLIEINNKLSTIREKE